MWEFFMYKPITRLWHLLCIRIYDSTSYYTIGFLNQKLIYRFYFDRNNTKFHDTSYIDSKSLGLSRKLSGFIKVSWSMWMVLNIVLLITCQFFYQGIFPRVCIILNTHDYAVDNKTYIDLL